VLQSLAATEVKRIADSIGDGDAASETTRAALQAVVGCAGAAAGGSGDCTSAAIGASTSVVANYLLDQFIENNEEDKVPEFDEDGNIINDISLEDQQARVNLVATFIAAVANEAGLDVASATTAAQIETENNKNVKNPDGTVVAVCDKGNEANCVTVAKLLEFEEGSDIRNGIDKTIEAFNLEGYADDDPLLVAFLNNIVRLQRDDVPADQILEIVDFIQDEFGHSEQLIENTLNELSRGRDFGEIRDEYNAEVAQARDNFDDPEIRARLLSSIFAVPGTVDGIVKNLTPDQLAHELGIVASTTNGVDFKDLGLPAGATISLLGQTGPVLQAFVLHSIENDPQALIDFDNQNPGFIDSVTAESRAFSSDLRAVLNDFRNGDLSDDNFRDEVIKTSFDYRRFVNGDSVSPSGEVAFDLLIGEAVGNARTSVARPDGSVPRRTKGSTSGLPLDVENNFRRIQNKDIIIANFPDVNTRVSVQRQARHIEGNPLHKRGSSLNNLEDAQVVLDAFHSGRTILVGNNQQGFPIVRFDGVTGRFKNRITDQSTGAARQVNEPTNVFIIKGTKSPSVVPANPQTFKFPPTDK